jgi:hypothetical protein
MDLLENPERMPQVPFGPYGRGPDAVPVVNITKVKAMCIPGKGVNQMLDHMVAAEKTRAWMATMEVSRNFISFNRMNVSVWSSESMSSSVRERGIALDEHIAEVRRNRKALLAAELAKRIVLIGTGPAEHVKENKEAMLLLHQRWVNYLVQGMTFHAMYMKFMERKQAIEAEAARIRALKEKKPNPVALAAWGLCFRVVKVWGRLLYKPRTRHRSIAIVKQFIEGLNESARIRVNVMRFIERVRRVQALCRVFIARRKGHMEILTKAWQRIEDKYLEQQFKENKQKMIEEARAKAEEEKRRRGSMAGKKDGGIDPASLPVKGDMWKQSRATEKVRERALYREYNARLQHFVRMKESWRSLNSDALNSQKDLNTFLKSLGAVPKQEDLHDVAPLPAPPPSQEFWRPSDEQMLEVIQRTEREEKDKREKAQEKRKLGMGQRSRKSIEAMERDITGVKPVEEVKKQEDFVMDHLFRNLSPRLQKISDACMKDDAEKNAQPAPPASKGARPAPALEEATASARKL